MASKQSERPTLIVPAEFSGLFHKHQDTFLADDSLSDMDVILVCIYINDTEKKRAGVEYNECRDLFISLGRKEDNFRKNLSSAKQKSLIQGDKTLYLLVRGLKRIWGVLGQVGKTPVSVIKSGENFTAIKLFEEFLLAHGKGDVSLCDSHISHSTLFPFAVLKEKIRSLRILTANVHDSAKFQDYRKRLSKELGISIEVKTNNKIHDRFILLDDKCWSVGSSIKDLGNKDTVIREISEVMASMKDLFQERWDEATAL
ncbi:MAG TPA: hypothetical protein VMT56_02985 [Candidatus Bathyarchaeia archaeon]|nr:hypothetical protein [Candidatus Bathyarchaeia archaeon]